MTHPTITIATHGPDHMHKIAATLVGQMGAGAVLALVGPLGAGKTTFVQGAVTALKTTQSFRVKSPTYALWAPYPTEPVLHHMDFYRLGGEDEAFAMGLHEALTDGTAIACVEWADRCPGLFPASSLWLQFAENPENERLLIIKLPSDTPSETVKSLENALSSVE
tara:strand:- start:569 stop:1063 length:495 start_codon:yes stop_codon:yes gene_type:complete